MKTLFLSILESAAVIIAAGAQPASSTNTERDQEIFVSMPEPPLGFTVSKHLLGGGAEPAGFQMHVVQDQGVGKVIVHVETRDLSAKPARIAALKGYINGFATKLRGEGFKIFSEELPDLNEIDFSQPAIANIVFQNDEGTQLFVRKRIFFTKAGYDVIIVAPSKEELEKIDKWAAHIRPAAKKSE